MSKDKFFLFLLFLAIPLVLLIAIQGRLFKSVQISQTASPAPNNIQSNNVEEFQLTPEQLRQYSKTYQNPYVLHIRTALNAYLNGTNEGMATPEFTIKAHKISEAPAGLDSFDKEYYKSKFIVYTMVDNIAGGKLIHIIFQDRPDKMFAAWVYQLVDNTYDFRDFWQSTQFDEEKMAEVRKIFKQYLEDKEHAL